MGDVIIDGLTGANRLVVLDANGKIPALDGSAVTNVAGANFSTGTIPVARLDTGTTAGKVVKLDGNAKLPAVSGAALTGIVGATQSASDPVITTNPSGGVGTEWQNTSTGEVFVCTDATAGANVWKNVGEHSGDVAPISHAQGTQYGYMTGGAPGSNIIDKYSFTSDGDSVDVANLTVARYSNPAGASSATHGYTACGGTTAGNGSNVIDRFHFANGTDATDVGDTFVGAYATGGSFSETHGYVHGGQALDTIQKYQMVASANGTDVGNLTVAQQVSNGAQSATHGYTTGTQHNQNLEKYSFTTDGNSTDVGDTTAAAGTNPDGCSSLTHGYAVGGWGVNIIEKFLFTNESTMIDVGDLLSNQVIHTCTSSSTHGYTAGGHMGSPAVYISTIHKFSFSAAGNATDIGDLGSHRSGASLSEGAGNVQY